MSKVMLVIHGLISALLIYLSLKQMGKFAELGGAFGSGAMNTVFGREKGLDTEGKITVIVGVLFFVSSILTAFFISR
ncbi:preprotein translocase subunit SecG [Thermosipho melanesiensis]|uniref:Protein-export membrane protein SecG n=2 Tax=Thermosipho melanesiensis TaxID=46541 RepID=A6LJF4_THEM4|nr:preprotein translocase subunit SecG [Thermosipho melanesiensis]ABR30055.1 preprotein translocase, SecG subunit [Thermosipho melanesiensis BI429]APT73252.1 preprotein translocase subunit SecG [Thermosipho melanesiensis]